MPGAKYNSIKRPRVYEALIQRGYSKERAARIANAGTRTKATDTYTPPAGAQGNARKVLRWREEHGDAVKGMTAVGWRRARQLASGEPISRDIVARMSAFNRHRKNSTVDPQYKDEPWRDAGYVAWLGWGGDTGMNWAGEIMGRTKAMRPKRRKLWQDAYANAKAAGLDRKAALLAARKALQRADMDKAGRQYARATMRVFKDAQGRDRWVAVSSTAYRDQDGEIVSGEALRRSVALSAATKQYGPLRFWHVPGVDLGDTDYQAVTDNGRFLVESGTFRSPALAAAVKAHAGDYQMSIGFTHPATEPDPAGVFHHISIFERSLVPAGKAANPFTRIAVKEQRMLSKEKAAALRKLVGDEVADGLLSAIQTTDKAAQAAGVAFKETTEAPPAVVVYTTPDGTQGIIQDGAFVALKAVSEKAPMTPMEMMQAAATEAGDAVEREDDEMMDEAEDMDLVDMSASDLKALIASAITEIMGGSPAEYASKMAELKAQYEAMGKAFTAQKEAKDTTADEVTALKAEIAALQTKLKELDGDRPAATPQPLREWLGVAAPTTTHKAVTSEDAAVEALAAKLFD